MALTDPMVFEQLRDGIEATLTANQSTYFRTIGEEKQSISSEEIKGTLRTVEVFFNADNNDEGRSTKKNLEKDATYQIYYSVSEAATADKAVLENPLSTPSEKQAALLSSKPGTRKAARSMDELHRMVTQIMMSPINRWWGLADYVISNARMTNFRKNPPLDHGNLIVITGAATLTARMTESLIGLTPVEAVTPAIDITLDQRPLGTDTGFDAPAQGVQAD